jgi:hypothetical protein
MLRACLPKSWIVLVSVLLAGCATQRIDWSSRIGNYTFDQAVLELGPPDKHATLTDRTVVAEWLTRRGGIFTYPAYYSHYGPHPYWNATPPSPTYVDAPDYFVRLTFDPQGRLQTWKRFAR